MLSKISQTDEWRDCVSFNEDEPDSWCSAWRRIMLNSNVGNGAEFSKFEPELFHRDVKTLLHWLWRKISIESPMKAGELSVDLTIKNIVCYRNASTLACPNNCRQNLYKVPSGRSKRELDSPDTIFYKRQWLLEVDNMMRCQCPEDYAGSNFNSRTMTPAMNVSTSTDSEDDSIFDKFMHLLKTAV